LVQQHYYTKHILRKPLEQWPEFINRTFKHLNPNIYIYMQGYSEFGITGNASLKGWDVSARLGELKIPTLMLGGKYDTMDPKYMEWMSTQVQKGRSVTTNGSHISQYDDAEGYFSGLIKFIKDVNEGNF
jgi:proline iminopeptidase